MSPTLSRAEIASMRSDVRDTGMPGFARIERLTPGAEDDYGQPGEGSWATIDAGVECFYSAGGQTSIAHEQVGQISYVMRPAIVTMPALTDITENDRITVTDTDGNEIGPLNVREVRPRLSQLEALVDEVAS